MSFTQEQVEPSAVCLDIGREYISRFPSEAEAVRRAPNDLLPDVILTVIWDQHGAQEDVKRSVMKIIEALAGRSRN